MIININGTDTMIVVDDSSYRYRAIMGENSLTLTFALPGFIDIPVGSYADFMGERYTLTKPQNFKKNNVRNFEYTLVLNSAQSQLDKYKFKDPTSNKLKFSLTAKPQEHLAMLVANLNLRDSGWTVGSYVDAVEMTISYNHNFCSDALRSMADAFVTEWEVVGKTISLNKIEYNKDTPLALSYGKGNGFKPGVGRTNMDNTKPVEILFVQGGTRNIDPSKYGAGELLLPKSQTYTFNGRVYQSDAYGLSIRRADKALSTMEEDSLDLSNVYPSRIGTITSVTTVDAVANFYDFIDTAIPSNLDYKACLIAGETMTVIFQSGMLAGRELEVSYEHATRKFAIVPQEIDGVTMPGAPFLPAAGDKYVVFGIQLPDAYICDNATQTGGSWDMMKQAAKYLFENEDPRFSFTGELDGIWAKANWLNVGGKIKLGSYVSFTDAQFQIAAVLIRISGVKEFINNPYKPTIELSNITVGGTVAGALEKLETGEVLVADLHREAIQFTKRRFRDAKETSQLLSDALLNFSGAINPVTVSAMQLLVGDESLQFRFVNSKTTPAQIDHAVTYDSDTKVLTSDAGILQHMSIGITTLSSSHAPAEYKFWDMAAYTSPALADPTTAYLYAKVSTTTAAGTFVLSTTAIKMESVAGFHHLLVGILNSEYDSGRSFVPLYGYTEVLPGRITTSKIVSADGYNFIDFVNNAFHVGNSSTFLDFNSQQDGKLRIKGTLIQSDSGIESPLGVFRGQWLVGSTYYPGDEVTNVGSTYRFIYASPAAGFLTTNATYWIVVAAAGSTGASGTPGVDGTDYEYIFARTATNTAPATPATAQTNDYIPTGWTDDPVGVNGTYPYEWTATRSKTGTVWSVFSAPAIWSKYSFDGAAGATGADGTDYEYIFKLTATNVAPSTPVTSQVNDFIPTGWTDDPTGVSSTNGYEWTATRSKTAGVWSVFSTPALWAKWGFDGSQGIAGSAGTNGTNGASLYTWLKYADTPTTGMSDLPTGKTYMGVAYNKVSSTESSVYSDYSWSLITGTQGIQGVTGANGVTTYTWVKYATSATGTGLNDLPAGMSYIGFAFNKTTATESTVATDYAWSLIQGSAGTNGTNGTDGAYFEYRYAKNGSTTVPPTIVTTDTAPTGWTVTMPTAASLEYLWITVAKKTAAGVLSQNWGTPVRVSGSDGAAGATGAAGMWMEYRYAKNTSLSIPPSLATTTLSPAGWTNAMPALAAGEYMWATVAGKTGDSSTFTQYWQTPVRISGSDGATGSQGVPGSAGTNGTNGVSLYTWLKYADTPTTGMTDTPTGKLYIGLAYNKTTATESSVYTDYDWTLIKGDQGIAGAAGANGASLYTWVKYATNASGLGISDSPTGMAYIGFAYNKTSATKSAVTTDYAWSLIQGATGAKGDTGLTGAIGNTGANGAAMAYAGNYNATRYYYGNGLRVDAVKYLGAYYLARVDAGLFNAVLPTDTSKWNTIGAQFEQVATNLLLAEAANIADWIIKNGQIVSQNVLIDGTTPKATLDGTNGGMTLKADITEYTQTGGIQSAVQTIELKSSDGTLKASTTTNEIAYISSQGLFANRAGIQAVSAATGMEIKAAIVGLENASLMKGAYTSGLDSICGIFGAASNTYAPSTSAAPSWGGIFYRLLANGLYLRTITTTAGMTLSDIDTHIASNNTATAYFYLPPTPQNGQVILIRKMNSAVVTVYGNGHSIMATSLVTSVNVGIGAGDLGFFVYDGGYWNYNYMSK